MSWDGRLRTVPAALQQHEAESARVKKSTEKEEEREESQQQGQKRAPGHSEETGSSDDRDSDFSLAGRCWSLSRHFCAVLDQFTGSVSSRFGTIKNDSAAGSIKTKPATEVKPARLSQASNNIAPNSFTRLLNPSRKFPCDEVLSLFQCLEWWNFEGWLTSLWLWCVFR